MLLNFSEYIVSGVSDSFHLPHTAHMGQTSKYHNLELQIYVFVLVQQDIGIH